MPTSESSVLNSGAPCMNSQRAFPASSAFSGYAEPACDGSREGAAANSAVRFERSSSNFSSSRKPASLSESDRFFSSSPTCIWPVIRTRLSRRSSVVCSPSKQAKQGTS